MYSCCLCNPHPTLSSLSPATPCWLLQGSKVFCLQYVSMQTIDVPQSQSMHRYLERGDHTSAYKVACLGVTDADWRALGMAALQVGCLVAWRGGGMTGVGGRMTQAQGGKEQNYWLVGSAAHPLSRG